MEILCEPAISAVRNKGGRPKGSKTQKKVLAAEFDAAVDKRVEEKFEALLAQLNVQRGEVAPVAGEITDGGDRRLINSLVHALTEVSDQDNRRVRVAPEELAARMQAREEMVNSIIRIRADIDRGGEYPSYQLTRKVFLDEQLIDPVYKHPTTHALCVQNVDWDGVPDESMQPANAQAKEIHGFLMRSIGGRTKEKKVDYTRATHRPGLRVNGQETVERAVPEIGNGRRGETGLRVHRPLVGGQVMETNVLGTVAKPAQQVG